MFKISCSDLCSLDYILKIVNVGIQTTADLGTYNYEHTKRKNNLLYFNTEGKRRFFKKGVEFLTINKNDIFFAPDNSNYTSVPVNETSTGFGICFDIHLHDGTQVIIDENPIIVMKDADNSILKSFQMIHYCFLNKSTNMAKLKAEMFSLIDKLFAGTNSDTIFESIYKDIYPAINFINKHPEQAISNEMLAKKCYMSTSSFARKFKAYTGGLTPSQYRNHIRFTQAEQLVNSSPCSLNEIAEILGFYDAAHLCRKYKQATGHTLRKNIKSI
ncbi:MAG: helix-turn-helix transcriptional regulator [Clostridia bacterium]|nr:helix-turn-helix transcriptional regulator [Clostridia bacterium]